jgi:hypothetical protein
MQEDKRDLQTDNTDPEHRRVRTDRARRDEIESQTRQRLNAAQDIAEALKKTHRTELSDRQVFASNLGRMWREAFPKDAAPRLASLFKEVFGDQGPTQYKKRARFVRFDGEDPDGTLIAHRRHFVELAEKIAAMAHEGQPADAVRLSKQRAVLQLVEGSSFDRRRPPAARLRDEAVQALIDCFDQILKRVENEVDLAEMRATIQQDLLAAVIDGDGEIVRLCEEADHRRRQDSQGSSAVMRFALPHLPNEIPLTVWDSDLDLGSHDSDALWRVSNLAPKVVIGDVYSPATLEGTLNLEIDADVFERQLREAMSGYGDALAKHGLSASVPDADRQRIYRIQIERAVVKALARRFGYPDDEECSSIHDLTARLRADDREPPDDLWVDPPSLPIYARRKLALRLAFDAAIDRWRLTLALVHGVGDPFTPREGVYGIRRPHTLFEFEPGRSVSSHVFEPCLNLGPRTGLLPSSMDKGSLFVDRVEPGRLMLYVVSEEVYPEEAVLGIRNGCLVFPSEPCLEALLKDTEYDRIDGHKVNVPFEQFMGWPAPAGWCTLAGLILRNLAYAPDAERYDLRLIADAKEKARLVADLAKARTETFKAAIRRLEQ